VLKPDLSTYRFSLAEAEAVRNAAIRKNRKPSMTPSHA
jgi:hypothetical protein